MLKYRYLLNTFFLYYSVMDILYAYTCRCDYFGMISKSGLSKEQLMCVWVFHFSRRCWPMGDCILLAVVFDYLFCVNHL